MAVQFEWVNSRVVNLLTNEYAKKVKAIWKAYVYFPDFLTLFY